LRGRRPQCVASRHAHDRPDRHSQSASSISRVARCWRPVVRTDADNPSRMTPSGTSDGGTPILLGLSQQFEVGRTDDGGKVMLRRQVDGEERHPKSLWPRHPWKPAPVSTLAAPRSSAGRVRVVGQHRLAAGVAVDLVGCRALRQVSGRAAGVADPGGHRLSVTPHPRPPTSRSDQMSGLRPSSGPRSLHRQPIGHRSSKLERAPFGRA